MTSTSGNADEHHERKPEVQALSMEQKLQILSSVLARVDADCQIILAKASQKKRLKYGDFKVIWADTEFEQLFIDVPSCVKMPDLIREVFYTITLYWQKPFMTYKRRVAVIFLLYTLVNAHPLGQNAIGIPLTPSDLNYWRDMEMEARRRQHHDVLYCMGSLWIRGQIRVMYSNRPYELLHKHSLRLEHHETPAPELQAETAPTGARDHRQPLNDAMKEMTQKTFCKMFKMDKVLKKYGARKKAIANTDYFKDNPEMEKLLVYVDDDFAVNFCNSMKSSEVDIIKEEIDTTAETRRQKKKKRDDRALAEKLAIKESIASMYVGHTPKNVDDDQFGIKQIRKLWYERLNRPMSPTPPSSEHNSDESLEPNQRQTIKYTRRHYRITRKLKNLLYKEGIDTSSSEEDIIAENEESKPQTELKPVPTMLSKLAPKLAPKSRTKKVSKSVTKKVSKSATKKMGKLALQSRPVKDPESQLRMLLLRRERAFSSVSSLDPLKPLEPQPGPSGIQFKIETPEEESDRDNNDDSILGI